MRYEVCYHKTLSPTGALPLMIEACLFFHKEGFAHPEDTQFCWDDEVIYAKARDTGRIVGVMTFLEQKWNSDIYIKLSYVRPHSRRQGVHKAMYQKLKEIARERGLRYIRAGVHINNVSMQEHIQRQGRRKVAIIYEEIITQENDTG